MEAFLQLLKSKHNCIAPMPWEYGVGNVIGLSLDLVRFTVAFFLSIPVGFGLLHIKSPIGRHLYGLVTGVLLVYYPFGSACLHVVPPAVVTYLGLQLFPRQSGYIAWFANFPYLLAMHVANASGMSWGAGDLDFTGGMMVLVLKLIALGVSYQDYHTKKPEELSDYQKEHQVTKVPNPLEYLAYIFTIGNLLAGPYIEYKVYDNFVHQRGVWDPAASKKMPKTLLPALRAMGAAMLCMCLALISMKNFPVSFLYSELFQKSGVFGKLGLMWCVGTSYRFRYYFAWGMMHASLIAAGLSFGGWTADGKPNWDRLCNAAPVTVETTDSARKVPLNWNIHTGHFLRRYVYERVTPKGKKPGFKELVITQLTSGVWHGLYPGYTMFFFFVAVMLYYSTVIFKWERSYLAFLTRMPAVKYLWHIYKVVCTLVTLSYLATAFLILSFNETMAVWASVYHLPVIYVVTVCVIGTLLPGKVRRSKLDQVAKPTKAE